MPHEKLAADIEFPKEKDTQKVDKEDKLNKRQLKKKRTVVIRGLDGSP